MSGMNRVLRSLARETRGAEIAEAAAVLPVMFMILLGIFWFGQAFSLYGTLTRAAQEGARAAVAPICATCSAANDPSNNAYSAVQTALVSAHLDVNKLQQPGSVPALCACSSTTCSSKGVIACDSGQSKICVQGVQHDTNGQLTESLVQLAPQSTGPGVCGVAVSFQYPFTFWLPFTSLNKRQIWLQAQAHVRAESQ